MIRNRMEQGATPRIPEHDSVNVEVNKSFKVEPPKGWLRGLSLDEFKGQPQHELYTFQLIGEGESRGKLSVVGVIDTNLAKREDEQLLLPMGTPNMDIRLDPTTGLTVIRSLPIGFRVSFGPYTRERMSSGDLGISIACFGKNYQAKTYDLIFEKSNGEQRAIATADKWQDTQTGKTGPLIFPSGTDFRQIDFLIKNKSR